MSTIDFIIVAAYLLFSMLIAIMYAKRARTSTQQFFLSGRNLPWWIAGTAMVATTFAADTPLAVTELVRSGGIAGNWLWWNMVAANIVTVFFFAKLWRRAGVTTDIEFIELRYSGKEASFLRGFKAVYLGLFANCIIMGWVNVALAQILAYMFGIHQTYVFFIVIATMIFVGLYAAVGGLWAVAVTDVVQFIIAMGGCIVLAYVVISHPPVNGIEGLKHQLSPHTLSFIPFGDSASIPLAAFLLYVCVQWWASWYPGAEPGGGGYVAQRMMSSKDEQHSLKATLWFTIAHFTVRPWPWIIVALATIVLYPAVPADQSKATYIFAIRDFLPHGLKGLLVAAFLAAYMSTISTHLNWGSSYLVNDLYRRFIAPQKSERHYVVIAQVCTIALVIISSALIFVIDSISSAWAFIIECGAGIGPVLMLRWYWWRINAWSEITAMIAPIPAVIVSRVLLGIAFPYNLLIIVPFTTLCWLAVTLLTKPVDNDKLLSFYKTVTPEFGFTPLRKAMQHPANNKLLVVRIAQTLLGIIATYSLLFGIGAFILHNDYALTSITVFAVSFALILYLLSFENKLYADKR
ncbi:MAG: Na+:solute symporter [Spirochaetes bacterium]|nr:Na+:solute symporter [Spirochaetota bacterium]